MREHKFKAWDKEERKWIGGIMLMKDGNVTQVLPTKPNVEIVEFTGLKDSRNREIYEGDIVDLKDNRWNVAGPGGFNSQIQVVKWDEDTCGFSPFSIYDCDCRVRQYPYKCEVIGDIYSNPELLKEAKDG